MKLNEKAKEIKLMIPTIYIAMKGKETPLLAKVVGCFTLLYALSPIDLIPDFIPVLGILDDLFILPLLLALTIRLIPKALLAKYHQEAALHLQNDIPKKWYLAIPIVIIWLLILFLISRAIFSTTFIQNLL